MRIVLGFALIVLLTIAFGTLAACASDNSDEAQRSSPAAGTASASTTPSPPPNPIVTESGIRVSIVGSFLPGWPRVEVVCEADGYVSVLDGQVVATVDGPSGIEAEIGEPVFRPNGDPDVEPVYRGTAAYRDDDGRLITSWRLCEHRAESGTVCEEDGYAWVTREIVTEVITQPSGEKTSPGEVVYGPFGEPLSSGVPTSMPVFRNEAGQLEVGWSKCDPPYRRDTATP